MVQNAPSRCAFFFRSVLAGIGLGLGAIIVQLAVQHGGDYLGFGSKPGQSPLPNTLQTALARLAAVLHRLADGELHLANQLSDELDLGKHAAADTAVEAARIAKQLR